MDDLTKRAHLLGVLDAMTDLNLRHQVFKLKRETVTGRSVAPSVYLYQSKICRRVYSLMIIGS